MEDSLQKTREQLVSIVQRVVEPLVNAIKNELVPLIEALETVSPPPPPTSGSAAKTAAGAIRSPVPHSSIMTLQVVVPIYARALSRIVASAPAENALASFVISLVWRGMVALSHRPAPPPSPPASPSMGLATLKTKDSKKALVASPPVTPPASRFTLKLPPSRPPSPPAPASRGPTVASDARTLYDLLGLLPKPSAGGERSRLAREVVDEAFEGLSALIALLESIQVHIPTPSLVAATIARPVTASPKATGLAELAADLDMLTAELPIVLALPLLMRTLAPGETRGVPAVLGMADSEYRRSCLSGFGRAEECGIAVGERVLSVLGASAAAGQEEEGMRELLGWLRRELETARAERDALH